MRLSKVALQNNNAVFDSRYYGDYRQARNFFYIMVGRSMGLILDKADCQPELIDFLIKKTEVSNLGCFCFNLSSFQKLASCR